MSGTNDKVAPESYPMNAGDGANSYNKNSYFQRATANVLKDMIAEVITDKLDIQLLNSSSSPNTICLTDLGCSVGPNTFFAMQNAIEAILSKHRSLTRGTPDIVPEFQVFFNDHTMNDFNTLFATLPPDRPYYAAAAPGSFHGRLFPKSSIHLVYSSFALQWLSRVPKEVGDRDSVAWNKGRIHCTGAGEEVCKAYEGQYGKDMEVFLKARAEEVVSGGLMVLIVPARPDGIPFSSVPVCVMYQILGFCLMDMTKEGIISEDQVDGFNLPLYPTSPSEISKLVEENDCFIIERMELMNTYSRYGEQIKGGDVVQHLRAGLEGIICNHFGNDIIDQLFEKFATKTEEFSHLLSSTKSEGSLMFLVLKRK